MSGVSPLDYISQNIFHSVTNCYCYREVVTSTLTHKTITLKVKDGNVSFPAPLKDSRITGAMQSSFTIEQQPVSPSPRRSFATTALVGVLGLFAVACLYSSGDASALRAQQRLRAVLG